MIFGEHEAAHFSHGVELLGHWVPFCLTLVDKANHCSKMVLPTCSHTINMKELLLTFSKPQ